MTTSPGPRSGDDTFHLIDNAVTALAERRGNWPGDDLAAIALIASLIDQAERWLPRSSTTPAPTGTAGPEPPRRWPPVPTRPACGSTPNPQSPTGDGPTTTKPARDQAQQLGQHTRSARPNRGQAHKRDVHPDASEVSCPAGIKLSHSSQ